MLNKYPKIFNLGREETDGVFEGTCDIYEKVDGSQLRWRWDKDQDMLMVGSKGQKIDTRWNINKLFKPSVRSLLKIEKDLFDWGVVYFGEALSKTKHGKIHYARVPEGNIVLWAAYDTNHRRWYSYNELRMDASLFNIECVTRIDVIDEVPTAEQLEGYMDTLSALGGSKVEGIVIKNHWNEKIESDMELCKQAKYVSAEFREMEGRKREVNNDVRDIVAMLKEENIWFKALQRYKENTGDRPLTDRDIGGVIKEVHADVDEEFKPLIMEELYKMYSKQLKRLLCKGVADFIKKQMVLAKLEEAENE